MPEQDYVISVVNALHYRLIIIARPGAYLLIQT